MRVRREREGEKGREKERESWQSPGIQSHTSHMYSTVL